MLHKQDSPIPPDLRKAVERLRAEMKRFADDAYTTGIRIAQEGPCLGWEQKVKDGTYGETEHRAHRDSDNWDGKHRGAWECIRMLDAFAEELSSLPSAAAGADADYHGMEYQLHKLPAIWFALANELKGNAAEVEKDYPEQAKLFRHRAISIIACADQLKWSLAHPLPQPVEADDHDSDCATHNEPAYPNGPCDCSLSQNHATPNL